MGVRWVVGWKILGDLWKTKTSVRYSAVESILQSFFLWKTDTFVVKLSYNSRGLPDPTWWLALLCGCVDVLAWSQLICVSMYKMYAYNFQCL